MADRLRFLDLVDTLHRRCSVEALIFDFFIWSPLDDYHLSRHLLKQAPSHRHRVRYLAALPNMVQYDYN